MDDRLINNSKAHAAYIHIYSVQHVYFFLAMNEKSLEKDDINSKKKI